MNYSSVFYGINGKEECINMGYPYGMLSPFGDAFPKDSVLIKFKDGRTMVTAAKNVIAEIDPKYRKIP